MVFADLAAGTMAGFAICGVGHPFDTLKVLMQMQPDKYKSFMDAAKETVSKHGVGGLYRGVGSPLIGNGLYNAVQFAVFARAKSAFTDGGRKTTLNRIAAAAAFTGIFVALVEGPQDLIKSQVQAQMLTATPSAGAAPTAAPAAPVKPKYVGTLDCARAIVRQRGLAGLAQGLSATIGRNIIGVCAYFYVYEALRMRMAGDRPVSTLSALEVLWAGGCGGLGYWVLAYPFDIIKSAIQTDALAPAERKYAGWADAARKLWAEGGVKRYTAGLTPCLLRSFPANAAGFAAYEATKKALEPVGSSGVDA